VTLEKYPDTLLGSKRRESFYDEESKEYFFDRDPQIFRLILNFYQTGKLHIPKINCLTGFEEELKFFGIPFSSVGDCCLEEYEKYRSGKQEKSHYDDFVEKPDVGLPASPTKRQRLWRALENPGTSKIASVFHYLMGFLILAVLIGYITDRSFCEDKSEKKGGKVYCGELYKDEFLWMNIFLALVFTLDYLMRLFAAPRRLEYLMSWMGMIDLICLIPFYVKDPRYKEPVKLLHLLLILKLARYYKGLRIWGSVLKSVGTELFLLVFTMATILTVFATVIFFAEKDVPGTRFVSIPAAFWYGFGSVMTIG
jgi:potassium voltage-gated channel Shal-related subfamily D protein 2